MIPLGFQLSVETDAFSAGGADLAARPWSFGLGAFYTGWDDFSIGLETAMSLLDRRNADDDFEAFLATFNLRYWP